jgi:polyphenol oxidase
VTASESRGSSRAARSRRSGAGWIDAGSLLGSGIGLTFTDRSGGVSPAPYDTLNLALNTGDEADNVHENRLEVSRQVNIPQERFIYLEQVHGLDVARAGLEYDGMGAGALRGALASTDGVFTTEEGLVLSVLTADCVPVAIAEHQAGVVAMLHAGWRGTIGNIVGIAMEMMATGVGIRRGKARVVLGPSIAPCCYVVDEGRARLFVERYGENGVVAKAAEGSRLDLVRANILNLIKAGVREENIVALGGCTCCEKRYFSYRRDGVTGRQGSFLYIREERSGAWGR